MTGHSATQRLLQPRAESQPQLDGPEGWAHMGTRPTALVLVVDDDEDIRETLRTLLDDVLYQVNTVASTAEALDYLRAARSPSRGLARFPDAKRERWSALA